MRIPVILSCVLLVCIVVLDVAHAKRKNHWKKIYNHYNKFGKHIKKNVEKVQHHAPGLISKADAHLQDHLNHRKDHVGRKQHHLHLQDLSRFIPRIVLPKPISTKRPDTTPMSIKNNIHHQKKNLPRVKLHKSTFVAPKKLKDLSKFKQRKHHSKKSGHSKIHKKKSKYNKKHGKKYRKHRY